MIIKLKLLTDTEDVRLPIDIEQDEESSLLSWIGATLDSNAQYEGLDFQFHIETEEER
jgi:hypothetical protein